MNNVCILLFGLIGAGKSTFGTYLKERYDAGYMHVKHQLEKKYGLENVPSSYQNLLEKNNSRSYLLDLLKDELCSLESMKIFILEGLFTMDEVLWCKSFFHRKVIVVYIETTDTDIRFYRVKKRGVHLYQKSKRNFKTCDEIRKKWGVDLMKNNADFIIYNNENKEIFFSYIDEFINKVNENNA